MSEDKTRVERQAGLPLFNILPTGSRRYGNLSMHRYMDCAGLMFFQLILISRYGHENRSMVFPICIEAPGERLGLSHGYMCVSKIERNGFFFGFK